MSTISSERKSFDITKHDFNQYMWNPDADDGLILEVNTQLIAELQRLPEAYERVNLSTGWVKHDDFFNLLEYVWRLNAIMGDSKFSRQILYDFLFGLTRHFMRRMQESITFRYSTHECRAQLDRLTRYFDIKLAKTEAERARVREASDMLAEAAQTAQDKSILEEAAAMRFGDDLVALETFVTAKFTWSEDSVIA